MEYGNVQMLNLILLLNTIAKIQMTYRAVDFLKHNLYQNI